VPEVFAFVYERLGCVFNDRAASLFRSGAYSALCDHFGRDELDRAYLNEDSPGVDALAAILLYIADTQKVDLSYLNEITCYDNSVYLGIDVNTRRNLELCETMRNKEKKGTLLWVLDKTKTAMGARLLRKWIEMPLLNCNEIIRRQNAVKELFDDFIVKEELQHLLSEIGDLERLMTRVVYNTTGGKDMKAIEQSIYVIKPIKEYI
jgi:DNA mismatch repair protein MutS